MRRTVLVTFVTIMALGVAVSAIARAMALKVDHKGIRQKEVTIQLGEQGPIKIESVEVKPGVTSERKEVLTLIVANQSAESLKVIRIKALVYRPNGKLRGGIQWNERAVMLPGSLKGIAIPLDISTEDGDHIVVSWGDNLLDEDFSQPKDQPSLGRGGILNAQPARVMAASYISSFQQGCTLACVPDTFCRGAFDRRV